MKVIGWMLGVIARLPLGVLYVLADVIWFILYYVVRYRRDVVRRNLAESFPEMSDIERRHIGRQFYRNFADYIVETLKLSHITDDEMRNRMIYEEVEKVDEVLGSGRSIVSYFSHCGNWEWAPSITLWSKFGSDPGVRFCQVYRPLKNVWFDNWLLKLRSRFGSHSFPKQSVYRDLIMMRRNGIPSITGFMSDQKPSHGDPTYILRFLNQPTAMITGTETVARRLGDVAMYMDMYKMSRGHYRVVMRTLADDPSSLPEGELTRRYASALEITIRRNPSIWLWTHKRWKNPVTIPDNEPQHIR